MLDALLLFTIQAGLEGLAVIIEALGLLLCWR